MVRQLVYWLLVVFTLVWVGVLAVVPSHSGGAFIGLLVLAFEMGLPWGSAWLWLVLVLGSASGFAVTLGLVVQAASVTAGSQTVVTEWAVAWTLIAGSGVVLLMLVSPQMRTAAGLTRLDWERWWYWLALVCCALFNIVFMGWMINQARGATEGLIELAVGVVQLVVLNLVAKWVGSFSWRRAALGAIALPAMMLVAAILGVPASLAVSPPSIND